MSAVGIVSRVTPVHTAVRNCTRDEGRPFEFGNQVSISSHRKLLSSKAMVVNVAEKSERDFGPRRQQFHFQRLRGRLQRAEDELPPGRIVRIRHSRWRPDDRPQVTGKCPCPFQEDSNSQMSFQKDFACTSAEPLGFPEHFGTRDFSRKSCEQPDMPLGSENRAV